MYFSQDIKEILTIIIIITKMTKYSKYNTLLIRQNMNTMHQHQCTEHSSKIWRLIKFLLNAKVKLISSHSQTYNNISMCKFTGKTPLYYKSSTENKSSSACCVKLHEVCCCWIVGVNFLVKVFHSAMKQEKTLSWICCQPLYWNFKDILWPTKSNSEKCTVHDFLWVNSYM